MKVLIVVKSELRHGADASTHETCGVAKNAKQVKEIVEKAIASRENSQRLESWIHPTILSFHVDEREVGVYLSRRTLRVWDKDVGFLEKNLKCCKQTK